MRSLVTFILVLSSFLMLKAQINSTAAGDWDNTGNWDCGCVPDVNSFDDIIVNHNMTITNDINLNRVTITNGNTVTINSGVTVTIEEDFFSTPLTINSTGTLINNGTLDLGSLLFFTPCDISGTLESSSTITLFDPTLLVFNSGSRYRHNFTSGGDIPVATWDSNSSVEISGLTDASPVAPNNLNQTFGNFVWNTPSMGATTTFSLGGQLTSILGNLQFISTGNPAVRIVRLANTGSGITVNIGGNFIMDGGTVFLVQALSTPSTITIDGNFVQNGGNLGLGAANNQNITFDVNGNFTKSAGSFTAGSGSGSGQRFITFSGSSTQLYSVDVLAGNAIQNFIIETGSTLNLGTSKLITAATSGTFTLNGTVILGSTSGSGALQDNIPIATRTFNSGSTIIYGGTGAQFMGSGHPSTSGVNCILNNSSGVTLATDVTLGGDLTLTSGNLSLSTRTLTLNGNFVPNSNSLAVTSNSSLSIGGSGAFGTLVTSGSATINNFTLNRNTTGSVTLGSDLTIAGTLTQTLGDIILNGRTLTISGPYNRTNGSFNVDASSSFIVNGSGALPAAITFAGAQALNTLTINRASTTFPTNSTLTVTNLNLLAGTFNNTGTITIATNGVVTRTEGSIINNTPQATTVYDIVYNIANDISTGAEIPSGSAELRNVTKTGGAALTLSEDVTINGNLTLSNGSFNASTFTVDLKGNFIANSTSILTSSPFIFSGNTTISGGSLVQFGAVTISGTLTPSINIRIDGNLINNGILNAGGGTTTFGGTTTISGSSTHNFNNITVTGTLTAPASMNLAGNFSSSGTFNASGGLIVFNGTTSITGTPTFHDITVSGALNGPASLNLTGHLRINGTFTPNSGTVAFIGTANQRIDRTTGGAATIDFFNITVNKSSGTFNVFATVASTVFRVQNNFTIAQNGASSPDVDFDGPSNNGTLVLRSTASRTAKITAVPVGATVVGLLTAERFMDNTNTTRAWRYFASPLVGATVADWQGEIQITGQFSNPSTGAGIPDPNSPSMYRWIETNGGIASNRWGVWPNNIGQAANTFALTNGRGYSMFVRNTGTPTMDVRGTLVTGNVNIGLTRTGSEVDAAGYNLVGNPYPAPIDWDLVSLPGGVSSTISLLDNVENGGLGTGQFVYYVQGGPQFGNFDGIIGSSQAFWVELTTGSSATLVLSESHKASDINPIIVRERSIANMLRINLQGVNSRDETIVYFNEDATEAVDLKFDATKKVNDLVNMYTYLDSSPSIKYAINGLGSIGCAQSIKIGINDWDASGNSVIPAGNYRFDFTEMESFIEDNQFTLIDHFSGNSINIKEQTSYEFSVTANTNSFGDTRFELIIAQAAVDNGKVLVGNDLCVGSESRITIQNSQQGTTYYASLNGNTISTTAVGNGSDLQLDIDANLLSLGENNVLVFGNVSGCTPVPMTQTLQITKDNIYNVQNVINGSSCKEGAVTLTATGAPSEGKYNWYEAMDAIQPIVGQETGTFVTPHLLKTKTYYVAAVNAIGCEGARKAIMAEVVNYDEVSINVVDNSLVSTYATGNQWYKDGEPITGATSQSFKPVESGVYKVVVSLGQCTSSSERSFTITGLEEEFWEGRIVVFPNPVESELTIEINDPALGTPVMLDMMGRKIGEIVLHQDGKKISGKFDFRSHPGGVYLLQVSDRNGKVYSKRITKK